MFDATLKMQIKVCFLEKRAKLKRKLRKTF